MKKIRIISALLAMLMLLALASCGSGRDDKDRKSKKDKDKQTEGTDGLVYYPVEDGTYGVAVGKAKDTADIEIASSYKGYAVTQVNELGFLDATGVETVVIPDSVVRICKSAFKGCSSLREITIPESVQEIGENAFEGCVSLEVIYYGGSYEDAEWLFATLPDELDVRIICTGNSVIDPGDKDEFFPDIERIDYNDDFNIFFAPSTNVDLYYMDYDGNDGSAMDESVFQRQESVQKYLGIEIVNVQFPDAQYDNYDRYVENAVMNMDGTMDMVMTHPSSCVSTLISGNLLRDYNELDGIDLDKPYWNSEVMDALAINGQYFLGYSDYNLLNTYVIAFNKDMLALYESSLEKSVYDLVLDKEWTLDQMISLASLVSLDRTGNGKTTDDTFGISGTCWVSFCGFLTSSNIPMIERDQDGAYTVAICRSQYYDNADTLVNRLKALGASDNAWFDYEYNTNSVPLTSGRTIMHVSSTNRLTGYLDYDIEFGVLPYPMFDLNQASVGYKSLNWGGYIGVLSYVQNPTMVAEALELLAFYSESVKTTYYEKLLGKCFADMREDAAMLEIVWDSVTADWGLTYIEVGSDDGKGVCYTVPELMWPSSTHNLASYIKGKEDTINKGFKKFLDNLS